MKSLHMDEESPQLEHSRSRGITSKVLIAVLVISVIAGAGTGFLMASTGTGTNVIPLVEKTPEHAAEDTRTFRDFAEGKISKKPETKGKIDNSEGTHLLMRDGATPVNLTSSVVDLSQYENKKVKVFGETQKATGAGWFMDVGRVEEVQ